MKKLTNACLRVDMGLDLDAVEEIKFLFKQGDRKLFFTYPSETAIRDLDTNTVKLFWSIDNTELFKSGTVHLDTFVRIKDSSLNPQTETAYFEMRPTFFEKEDVDD